MFSPIMLKSLKSFFITSNHFWGKKVSFCLNEQCFGFMMGLHWKGFIIEHAFFSERREKSGGGGGGLLLG